MDWFRSYHGAPTDPKWLAIAKRAGVRPGDVAAIFWALLDHASQDSERGSVEGFDTETVAGFYGYEESEVEAVISAMTSKGIIIDGRLACWDKRQPKREDDSKDRTRAYRERMSAKPEPKPPGDGVVTHGDAPVTQRDNREEEIREEKKEEDARASAPADAKAIWFEGQALRVNRRDFETWQRLFPGYTDLWGELAGMDVKLAAQGHVPGSKSFLTAAGWLKAGHERIIRARPPPPEPLRLVAGETA